MGEILIEESAYVQSILIAIVIVDVIINFKIRSTTITVVIIVSAVSFHLNY